MGLEGEEQAPSRVIRHENDARVCAVRCQRFLLSLLTTPATHLSASTTCRC